MYISKLDFETRASYLIYLCFCCDDSTLYYMLTLLLNSLRLHSKLVQMCKIQLFSLRASSLYFGAPTIIPLSFSEYLLTIQYVGSIYQSLNRKQIPKFLFTITYFVIHSTVDSQRRYPVYSDRTKPDKIRPIFGFQSCPIFGFQMAVFTGIYWVFNQKKFK